MPATTTTIAALRAYLFDTLAADAGLAGVLVTYEPTGEPTRDTVTLAADVDYEGEYSVLKSGRKTRRGMYTFEVVFRSVALQAQRANEARAVEMLGVLEDIVADSPSLSDAVSGVLTLTLTDLKLEAASDADGFAGVELRATVTVEERLQ